MMGGIHLQGTEYLVGGRQTNLSAYRDERSFQFIVNTEGVDAVLSVTLSDEQVAELICHLLGISNTKD